jgi:exopolysaccharide production protein ExoZ
LRAIAALAVVAYHALEPTTARFTLGAAGVDLFFVISGFLMWTLADAQNPSPQAFIWRRIIRIVPLYWAITIFAALSALLFPSMFWNFDPSLDNVWKSLLFIPHLSKSGGWSPLLVQGWTLNYEMFFYVLFALCLFAPARRRLLLICAPLLVLPALALFHESRAPLWATYTDPLLLEFLAGIALGEAWRRGIYPGARLGAAMLITGFALLAVQAFLPASPERWRALLWGAPALVIMAGAIGLERAGKAPFSRPLLLLGDASYSIYLLHALVMIFVAKALAGADHWTHAIITFPLSALAGVACYKLFEVPMTRLFKSLGAAFKGRNYEPNFGSRQN